MFNTGARVQEVIDLRASDLQLVRPYQLRFGKGRKERYCPFWPQTAGILSSFCKERAIDLRSDDRLFLNHRGAPLTPFGVRYIFAKHVDRARSDVTTLGGKRLHSHSMRHSTAVALLKSGVDISRISQWLGHASPTTTNRYATIDLDMKRPPINQIKPVAGIRRAAWRTNETILKWPQSL
jgi:site-specific recombinase XerD